MAQRDVAQLILQVDARIATAQRAVNQLAKAVEQDAAKMDKALEGVAQSHRRVGQALNDNGRLRAGMTQLSFQIGDVTQGLAMGTRASTIFAQQSGQVIQALQVMGGEGNKFLRFLSGPWGIAISTAAVILGTLAGKLFEGRDAVGDLVEKMREQAKQAKLNERANEAWGRSIEGVIEKTRELRDETEKQLQTDADRRAAQLAEQEARHKRLNEERKKVALDLERARVELERRVSLGAGTADDAQIAQQRQKVTDLAKRYNELTVAISQSGEAIANLGVFAARDQADVLSDPAKKIKAHYDALRKTAEATIKDVDRLAKRLADLNRQEDAALKKLQDKGGGKLLTTFGLPVDGSVTGRFGEQRRGRQHAGVDLAVPVGTQVRAPASGVVIEAGQLPGYGNVVFIDHGGGTVSRLAHLSKIGVARGTQISAGDVIGLSGGAKGAPGSGNSEGPHVHWEVRSGGRAVDPLKRRFTTDEAAAALKAGRAGAGAADAAIRRENAFEEQLERLNEELLRAKAELVQGTDAEADFAIEMLQLAAKRRELAIQNDVEEGKLTKAQADQLKAVSQRITYEKAKAVEIQRQLSTMRQQSEAEQRTFQYRIDDLRFADEMATTNSERRRLQLQILDIVYQQKEAHLLALKAELELAGKIAEAAQVQEQINRLPIEKDRDRQRTNAGTMDPLEAWAKTVPKTSAQIQEEFGRILVNGIDPLADAITDVIMGTESLGKAFAKVARGIIADIIQMTVRMLIFRAISGIMGGGLASINSSQPVANGTMTITQAKGGAWSRGNLVPFALGGVVSGPTLFPLRDGKTGLMGEAGPEAIMPLAKDSSGRLGVRAARAAASGGQSIELLINFGPSPEFVPIVEGISARTVSQAAPVIVKAAVNQTMRAAIRPKLMGGR